METNKNKLPTTFVGKIIALLSKVALSGWLVTGVLVSLCLLGLLVLHSRSEQLGIRSSSSSAAWYDTESLWQRYRNRLSTSFSNNTSNNTPVTCGSAGKEAFRGCYYSYTGQDYFNPTNLLLSRIDPAINFEWTGENGRPSSPDSVVPGDNFSAIWEGDFTFSGGTYNFTAFSDDGMRIYVDGVKIFDKWYDQGPTQHSVSKAITQGTHRIKVEYYESWGWAVAQVSWSLASSLGGDIVIGTPIVGCPTGVRVVAESSNIAVGESTSLSVGLPTSGYIEHHSVSFSLISNPNSAVDLSGAVVTGIRKGTVTVGGRAWFRQAGAFCTLAPVQVAVDALPGYDPNPNPDQEPEGTLNVSHNLVVLCENTQALIIDIRAQNNSADRLYLNVGGQITYVDPKTPDNPQGEAVASYAFSEPGSTHVALVSGINGEIAGADLVARNGTREECSVR